VLHFQFFIYTVLENDETVYYSEQQQNCKLAASTVITGASSSLAASSNFNLFLVVIITPSVYLFRCLGFVVALQVGPLLIRNLIQISDRLPHTELWIAMYKVQCIPSWVGRTGVTLFFGLLIARILFFVMSFSWLHILEFYHTDQSTNTS